MIKKNSILEKGFIHLEYSENQGLFNFNEDPLKKKTKEWKIIATISQKDAKKFTNYIDQKYTKMPSLKDIRNELTDFLLRIKKPKVYKYRYAALNKNGKEEPFSGIFETLQDAVKWHTKHGIDFEKDGIKLILKKIDYSKSKSIDDI